MPTREAVDRAVHLLRQSANYQYFFEQLQSADWIEPLLERGFFQHPPRPVRDGDYVRIPIWVESRYLVRVAAQAPELTARILLALPDTENTRVHEDVVEAACEVSPDLAAALVPQMTRYLDAPYQFLLPEKVKDLVLHLLRGNQFGAALDLARAMLWPRVRDRSEVAGFAVPSEPRPGFSHPEYGDVLRDVLVGIAESDPRAAYGFAAELLEAVLSIGNPDDRTEDFSYIWRPAIEDSPRNTRHQDMRDDLVVAVRDSAQSGELDVRELIEDLEARQWPVFRRLALHALTIHADALPDMVRDRALDVARLADPTEYHEYLLLLREALPRLSEDERSGVVEAIEAGPGDDGGNDTKDERRRRAYWTVRTLTALEPVLPSQSLVLLARLRRELGLEEETLAEADFLTPASGGVWVGPASPLTVDEILSTPDAELIGFLASWVPPEEWTAASPEGLGRTLQEAVKRQPQRLSHLAPQFVGLDATYVRSAIQGWREAIREATAFEWAPVLQLCAWSLGQGDPEPLSDRDRDRDPDWSWARRALADLLSEGLTISEQAIPFDQRDVVWAMLSRLAEDPDPTPQHEEHYGGSNMDPVTLAINTVRGEAMHAVIRYALWVRDKLGEGAAGFDDMPEVRHTLDRHLDRDVDPSLAVRSAYGQYFPWLHLVDAEWAEAGVSVIFPPEPDARPWFDAAWDAYIVFTRPFDRMAQVLRAVYSEAVERLPHTTDDTRPRIDPAAHLAEHIAVFIARGIISLDDALVHRFFELAPPQLRGHVHEFLGRTFCEVGAAEEVVRRSTALWDMRAAMALQAGEGSAEELVSFGWWFAARSVDLRWRMANLLDVLRATGGQIDFASSVLEELSAVAEELPREAVEAVQLLARAAGEGWEIIAGREHIRAVLATGLRADAATRSLAEDVAHELGARGYTDFRSVLDQS